jgi:hypothetical protein
VLRGHCADVGRDYDDIEKTVLYNFAIGENGERVDETIEDLRRLAGLGFTVAHGGIRNVHDLKKIEIIRDRIMPAVADR